MIWYIDPQPQHFLFPVRCYSLVCMISFPFSPVVQVATSTNMPFITRPELLFVRSAAFVRRRSRIFTEVALNDQMVPIENRISFFDQDYWFVLLFVPEGRTGVFRNALNVFEHPPTYAHILCVWAMLLLNQNQPRAARDVACVCTRESYRYRCERHGYTAWRGQK